VEKEQDIILVQKAKEGDKDAFCELVKKYKRQVYFVAYRMTNNHFEADDLSQEAFVKAYESIGNFKEKSAFSTWIYRIITNMTIDYIRKNRTKQVFELDENISIKNSYYINNPIEERELHKEIKKAIGSLPLEQRAVVELSILEGLTHKKIAEILDCPEKTVSWRLFQARNKLKEKLEIYREVNRNEL